MENSLCIFTRIIQSYFFLTGLLEIDKNIYLCQKDYCFQMIMSSWSNWWTTSNLGEKDANLATNCPQLSKCSFSTDRVRLNTSSLVLFSYGDTILADLPPKYLLKPKWGLFLSQPTKRHAGRIWNQFLPMFDVLISYFPNSDIQMYEGKFSKKKGHNFGFIKLFSQILSSLMQNVIF